MATVAIHESPRLPLSGVIRFVLFSVALHTFAMLCVLVSLILVVDAHGQYFERIGHEIPPATEVFLQLSQTAVRHWYLIVPMILLDIVVVMLLARRVFTYKYLLPLLNYSSLILALILIVWYSMAVTVPLQNFGVAPPMP